MLRSVDLVRTDVSEERSASITVTRICELGTILQEPHGVTFQKTPFSSSLQPEAADSLPVFPDNFTVTEFLKYIHLPIVFHSSTYRFPFSNAILVTPVLYIA
jgi:hypothetical protein